MGEARTRSAVELLGRAPVLAGNAGLNAAAATVSNTAAQQRHVLLPSSRNGLRRVVFVSDSSWLTFTAVPG